MMFSAAFTAIFWLLGAAILGGLIVYFLMQSRYATLLAQYTGLQGDFTALKKNCEAKQIELNAEIERLRLQINPLQLSIDEKETQIVVFKRDYMLKTTCEDEQNAQRTLILNLQNQLSGNKNVDLSAYIEKGEYDNLKGKHFSLKNEFDALSGTYQVQINDLNAEISRLKAQISQQEAAKTENTPMSMANAPKQEIDLSLYVEKNQYEKLKKNHDTLQSEHKTTISDRDMAFGKYNATIDELKKRIANVGNAPQTDLNDFISKNEHQKAVANLKNELDLSLHVAREELSKLSKEKQEKEAKALNLKNELDLSLHVAREELLKLSKEKKEKEEKALNLKNELDLSLHVAREELLKLSKEKQEKEAKALNLKNELDLSLHVAREQLSKLSKEKQEKEAKALNLKNELDLSLHVAREELLKLSKEKKEKETEIGVLKADLGRNSERNAERNASQNVDLSVYILKDECKKLQEEKLAEINDLKMALENASITPVVASAVIKKEKISAEDKKEASLEKIRRRADSFDYSNMGVATATDKDDLKIVLGIGPFIEEKLNALGIYLFLQISKFNDNDVEQVTKAIEFFPGRITRDDWITQSAELYRKKVAGEPLE